MSLRLPLDFAGLLQIGSGWFCCLPEVLLVGINHPLAGGGLLITAKRPTLILGISSAVARASSPHPIDFDQTLGFPGEGPHRLFTCWVLSVSVVVAVGLFGLPALLCFVCFAAEAAGASKFYPLMFVGFSLRHGCLAMQPQLGPRDRQGQSRASGRAAINLGQGRPVLERTKKGREKLLDGFSQWLDGRGVSFADFLNSELTDLDTVNLLLERYGRELFSAGRPYGHYSELVNGIASLRPRFRRSLQGAWDFAYSWLRHEPPCHHAALPWQPLVALLVTSFSWGWVRVAGVVALSWGALTRIGKLLAASRSDLVLPSDLGGTTDFALLQIREPKTRHRGARHQVARLDQPDLRKIIEAAFARLPRNARLWPFSGQTLRK